MATAPEQAGAFGAHLAGQAARLAQAGPQAAASVLRHRIEAAQDEAAAWDRLQRGGMAPPLFGVSLAVKACFDVAGWPTTSGSQVMFDAPPAAADAALVATLRHHGAVVSLQSGMTEFAFGALGLNTHFGTPRTPLDPSGQGIAGGSTSGGAVAVASGFADLALGSDTSGSVRIPAAFCGLAAFKPSRGRYADGGMAFLSTSFDVPGFISRDVALLLRVDRALVGAAAPVGAATCLKGRRFLVPQDFALQAADTAVAAMFEHGLRVLADAGADIVRTDWHQLSSYGAVAATGGILIAEAFALHRERLAARAHLYDPRVGPRIAAGGAVLAADYLAARAQLVVLQQAFHAGLAGFDALLTPTVPILPPRVDDLADDATYLKTNRMVFSLTEVANRIDAPSVSLPVDPRAPIGLLLTGHQGRDQQLLDLAEQVQSAFQLAPP